VLAAIITAGRWGWHFGASLVARDPSQLGDVAAVEAAAHMVWTPIPSGFGSPSGFGFARVLPSDANAKWQLHDGTQVGDEASLRRWRSVRDVPSSYFVDAPVPPLSVGLQLHPDPRFFDFHCDPPLTESPWERRGWDGLMFLARLGDGSRVWVIELSRPMQSGDWLSPRWVRHRQILVFDESLGKVLGRSGRLENLWSLTWLPTVEAFGFTWGIAMLGAAVPIVLAVRRAMIVRRRFLARRCVACDYNFAGHGDGLLTCPECGQVQWPVDVAGIGA
jgi:hypothetical protein